MSSQTRESWFVNPCFSDFSEDTETSSSGVSSYSGQSGRSSRRQRKHPLTLEEAEPWTWRPRNQVTAPPPRVTTLLDTAPVEREVQLQHCWSDADHSPNIYIKHDDPLTFHRNPVYQTTDAIRGKGGEEAGYTCGLHVWEVTWPADFRGTHPVVGVATRDCPLTEPGYKRIVGSNTNSWGWCLKSLKVYHDNRKYKNGVAYPRDIDEKLKVPTTFYMILDCDRGTLAFQVKNIFINILILKCETLHLLQVENDFLGVAFSGLRGEELFPIVSAVWGHCEVTLTYIGNNFIESES